jgi:hypothetical protein
VFSQWPVVGERAHIVVLEDVSRVINKGNRGLGLGLGRGLGCVPRLEHPGVPPDIQQETLADLKVTRV